MHPGDVSPSWRDRGFADSLLERDGFEPSVPQQIRSRFRESGAGLPHFIRVKKKGTGAMSGKPGRWGENPSLRPPNNANNVKILVGLGVPAGDDLPVGGEPADRQAIG